MKDLKETAFNYYVGEPVATFYTSEIKWINRIYKLVEEYPDDVKIVHKNSDGSLVANIPVKWFKIQTPRKLSDEQRDTLRDRLIKSRNKKESINYEDIEFVGRV